MNTDDIQAFKSTLAVEGAKNTAEFAKDVADDIVRPTSKSIGNNLGLLVDGALGWLDLWGEKQKIKQQQNLEEFKNEINLNIESIPTDKLKEPTMSIAGPAIEASKFYFEENYYKEMFSKLIAASCDNRYTNKISPYFVEAIKQLSPKDATIISTFKETPEQPIANYRYILANGGGEADCYTYVFYLSGKMEIPDENSSSLVNLERLGLVSIDFVRWFVDDSSYDAFTNDPTYVALKEAITKQSKNIINLPYEDLIIDKGIVKITPLGKDFINLCL